MIGQDKILNKLSNMTLDNLPHSIIIAGEWGSGRHTLLEIISKKFNLHVFDITNRISYELIEEIYFKIEPLIYVIDLDKLSIREENMILKLVEEPLNNSYIIFICESKNNVLPTILNRCQVWELQKYSEEQLRFFLTTITDDYPRYFDMLKFCNTPGQVIYCSQNCNDTLVDMVKLANLIISKIQVASFSNVLNIVDKLGFKEENDKYNVNIFLKVLMYCLIEKIKIDNNYYYLYFYDALVSLMSCLHVKNIDKQRAFENFLVTLKQCVEK